jgi:N-acetylmuramoyl-L-alanine amidase
MPQASKVSNIVIHCQAGFGTLQSMIAFWKSKGWRSAGYHFWIETNGTIWWLTKNGTYSTDKTQVDFTKITNGVLGHNNTIINGCYQGGVENLGTAKNPIWKAKDTRTPQQNRGLDEAIQEAISWLKANGKDVTKNLGIVGHFDFSPDKNGTGVIESFERIKECPSFNVIKSDLHYLYSSKDRYGKLPTQK